jgi:membrane associated rhomboid family serine protease
MLEIRGISSHRMRSLHQDRRARRGIFGILLSNVSLVGWIILINFVVYLTEIILLSAYPDSIKYFALNAENILAGKYLWTIVTHMFSHVSFFHLFVNMFSLYFIGGFAEKVIGRKRFLLFYLISGIFAGILSVILAGFFGFGIWEKILGSPSIPMIGASGAIFGLVGLLAVLVPYSRVYLIAGPLIAIVFEAVFGVFVKSSALLGIVGFIVNFYIILSILMMFSFNPATRKIIVPIELPFWLLPIVAILPLVIIGFFVFLPIGNVAHFGGLLAGLVYGAYLRKRYSNKVKMLQRYFR